VRKVLRQTEFRLFYLIILLLILWIVIKRVNLRKMACSQEKSKWAIPSGVVVFIAVLNSIAVSFISMVILGSVELYKVIGNSGMFTVMILAPLIPSGLISFIIFRNRRWVYYTLVLTLVAGLYLIVSCFYCIG